ncbi:hypothetical protein GE253_01940 [Niveispirillum sp. SYP-B3756]|uniref:hypothetical protein n=1 Tax=Niveispirillum sp. SYP-B3756 TaxID=2662178 RepID=UPI0012917E62|nr:hypothetical protein [Niveispirillum sp. SYP-B3756]MQP64097.1 hypothetical protein [Niveispirillum sp. SYP-B3756]
MFIHVGLILLILVSITYAAAVLRKIEGDVVQHQRDMRTLEEEHHQLEVACNTLGELLSQVGDELASAQAEVMRLSDEKAQQEAALAALEEAPKQRLFLVDRSTLTQAKLWEVTILNGGAGNGPGVPVATSMEWAAGRTYLIAGATDRDARYRAEPRFPSGQGYRIAKIERFRRA